MLSFRPISLKWKNLPSCILRNITFSNTWITLSLLQEEFLFKKSKKNLENLILTPKDPWVFWCKTTQNYPSEKRTCTYLLTSIFLDLTVR
jgi:hypothetical protein